MIVRVIDVFVLTGRISDFRSATVANHEKSLKEEGILRFDVLQDTDDESHFILYEVYTSADAADAHKQTAHYAEWKSAVESMMAKPRGPHACSPIAPADQEMWSSTRS